MNAFFNRTLLLLVGLMSLGMTALSQQILWSRQLDSISCFSSPQAADLNQDGVLDLVIGAGMEQIPSHEGVLAYDGKNGNLLWKHPSREQIFGTALFRDLNGDTVPEVFIGGRGAVFFALDGRTGQLIWEFWPDSLPNPQDSGWSNFYNPMWIEDQDQDGTPDLILANGGDPAAIAWDSTRPPGKLVILSTATGNLIASDTLPDGRETYSTVLVRDLDNSGDPWIFFGSGGETVRGSFWRARLSELRSNDLSAAVPLLSDTLKGYIAAPSTADLNGDQVEDLLVPAQNGRLTALSGSDFSQLWEISMPGYENYVSPAIGQFTGDPSPDVFGIMAKGQWSFYAQYVHFLVDGQTGQIVWTDTTPTYQFSQVNVLDWNLDGWDEVLQIENSDVGFTTVKYRNQFRVIDFHNDTTFYFGPQRIGLHFFGTPLIQDLDGDQKLDLIYTHHTKEDEWYGLTGTRIDRMELPFDRAGMAWPGYLGRDRDGRYHPSIGLSRTEHSESPFRIYPQPTGSQVSVTGKGIKSLEIFDLQGRRLGASPGSSLDLGRISPGIYLLRIETTSCEYWQKMLKK